MYFDVLSEVNANLVDASISGRHVFCMDCRRFNAVDSLSGREVCKKVAKAHDFKGRVTTLASRKSLALFSV